MSLHVTTVTTVTTGFVGKSQSLLMRGGYSKRCRSLNWFFQFLCVFNTNGVKIGHSGNISPGYLYVLVSFFLQYLRSVMSNPYSFALSMACRNSSRLQYSISGCTRPISIPSRTMSPSDPSHCLSSWEGNLSCLSAAQSESPPTPLVEISTGFGSNNPLYLYRDQQSPDHSQRWTF